MIIEQEAELIDCKNYSWCRGIGGILLARCNMLNGLEESLEVYKLIVKQFREYFDMMLMRDVDDVSNLCICHGIYGDYEILNSINREEYSFLSTREKERLTDKLNDIGTKLLAVTPTRLWVDYDCELESFMIGSSGIGYSLLRLQDGNYPSILNLELL